MVALNPPALNSSFKALDFNLLGIDDKKHNLKSCVGEKGLVIMFICNHCPFVKAIANKLANDMQELKKIGVNAVAINSNDVSSYPEDSFDNMKIFAKESGFKFPYLIDETQEVAKAYDAVCTPDFFGFDSKLNLQYRGRLDDSGMQFKPDGKRELLLAMQQLAQEGKITSKQVPSIGCNIKWKE